MQARAGGGGGGAKGRDTAVEMALDPEEIDFDSETMALKAEAALRYDFNYFCYNFAFSHLLLLSCRWIY